MKQYDKESINNYKMKRIVLSLIFAYAFMFNVCAQKNMMHELEYESFTSVKVSDEFVVKLYAADIYKVRTVVDARLDSYVKAYVQNGTLYIDLDRKSFPSDLKKALRTKGAPSPVLEVEVYFPSIKSLEMTGNTILHRSDILYSDAFSLAVSDRARVDKIYVDCNTAEINLSKTAYADVEVKAADELYVITSNNSKAVVKQTGKGMKIDAAGSSIVNAIIEVERLNVLTVGTAVTTLVSGNAGSMKASAAGASKIDAEAVSTPVADMSQAGTAKCYVNVTDTLRVNLTGNSMLTFKNKPYIDVERIIGSTLIKSDDPKRR